MKKLFWAAGCLALMVSCSKQDLEPVNTAGDSEISAARAFYRKIDAEFNLTSYYYSSTGNTVAWDIASVEFSAGNTSGVYSGEQGVTFSREETVRDDAEGTYTYSPFKDKYLYFDNDVPSVLKVNFNKVQAVRGVIEYWTKYVATVKVYGDGNVFLAQGNAYSTVTGMPGNSLWENFSVSVDLSGTEAQSDYKVEISVDVYSQNSLTVTTTIPFVIDGTFDQTGYNIERSVANWRFNRNAFWGETTPEPDSVVITSDKLVYFWQITEGWLEEANYWKSFEAPVFDPSLNKYVKVFRLNDFTVSGSYKPSYNNVLITDHAPRTVQVTFVCEGDVEYVRGYYGLSTTSEWDFTNSFQWYDLGVIRLVSAYGDNLREGQPIYIYDITNGRNNPVLIRELEDYDSEIGEESYYKRTRWLATTNKEH